MKGHQMRMLFVLGEVIFSSETNGETHCSVNITNDGWHVCEKTFLVKDVIDLENQFYGFLYSEEFKAKLHAKV
jgi:hypothetical protein